MEAVQHDMELKRPHAESSKENNEKPAYQKKFKRGVSTWQDSPSTDSNHEDRDPTLKKRKVALLMSYCGTGYQGMQINPNVKTIEQDLHKALAASGAVSTDNAMDPNKISFMRAARTDKGVHAAGQVVSLKVICHDDTISSINQHLPPQIRVWGIVRTKNGFHAKNHCDSRIYEYLMPTYVLQPANPHYYPYSALQSDEQEWPSGPEFNSETGEYTLPSLPPPTTQEMETICTYRIDPTTRDALEKALSLYVGNHNYHNFTLGKKYQDRSSMRNIKSFNCGDPFVKNGIEWISLKVHGQSFMIHQIRKMVGLVIMLIRTKTPLDVIPLLFGNIKVNIPKAPSLGLLLERIVYDIYNQNVKDPRKNEPFRDPIQFDAYQADIDAFKEEWIYSKQMAQEQEEYTQQWLRAIDSHCYEYMWYLTAQGKIDHSNIPKTLIHLKGASDEKEQ